MPANPSGLDKLRRLRSNIQQFSSNQTRIASVTAAVATNASQKAFRNLSSGRVRAPNRSTRQSFNLGSRLQWKAYKSSYQAPGGVRPIFFIRMDNIANLKDTPGKNSGYWVIQELGTGKSGTAFDPFGKSNKMQTYSIQSQKGRRIPRGLAWANAPGQPPSLPGAARGQNLFKVKDLQWPPNGTTKARLPRAGRIRVEIKAKHYIRNGSQSGMAYLRNTLEREFKQLKK